MYHKEASMTLALASVRLERSRLKTANGKTLVLIISFAYQETPMMDATPLHGRLWGKFLRNVAIFKKQGYFKV
jgi:hypothetical protein